MKTSILDPQGENIIYQPEIASSSREKTSLKIYNFFTAADEQQEFMNGFSSHILSNNPQIEDNKLKISVSSQEFQDFCVGYGAQKIINSALDEDLVSAYQMLINFSSYPNQTNKPLEEMEVTLEDIDNIAHSFIEIPELQIAVTVCNIQSEISGFFSGNNGKKITSYQANRLEEKFADISDFLNNEQKAAGYYNLSIVYRALLDEKESQLFAKNLKDNDDDNNAEADCLKKVLEYSADYKRINYCINRIGPSGKTASKVIAAYKKALNHTDVPSDLRKINLALAETYLNDYKPTCGFKVDEKEMQKLQNAEYYMSEALKVTDKAERESILKSIAHLQLKQNKFDKWANTMTTLAFKYLKGEDRCQALIDTGTKYKKYQTAYLERALYEVDKSRIIPRPKKAQLVSQIAHYLQPIYGISENKDSVNRLDKMLEKYGCNAQTDNPLHKFKMPKHNKSK